MDWRVNILSNSVLLLILDKMLDGTRIGRSRGSARRAVAGGGGPERWPCNRADGLPRLDRSGCRADLSGRRAAVPCVMARTSSRRRCRRLAWALTGSGHDFVECLDLMRRIGDMDVFLSKAAAEVIFMYTKDRAPVPRHDPADQGHLGQRRPGRAGSTMAGTTRWSWRRRPPTPWPSAWPASPTRWSPTCSPRPASAACRSIVYACDTKPVHDTMAPGGMVRLWPRRIDLENTERLKGVRGDDGGRGHGRAGAGGRAPLAEVRRLDGDSPRRGRDASSRATSSS